jgi:hypothetical protein
VHLEARAFAKRVAAHLADACRQGRFDELSIIAAPRFVGLLRQELDATVKQRVVARSTRTSCTRATRTSPPGCARCADAGTDLASRSAEQRAEGATRAP